MASSNYQKFEQKYEVIRIDNSPLIISQKQRTQVTAAVNKQNFRIVAVKQLEYENKEIFYCKKNEIEILQANQSNPFVIQLQDVFVDSVQFEGRKKEKIEKFYMDIVTEIGTSLYDVIVERNLQGRYFTATEMLSLTNNMLQIGAFLEDRNVVNRVIRPDNFIFIAKSFSIKIANFGIATLKIIQDQSTLQLYKNTINQAMEALQWMSPEMRRLFLQDRPQTANQELFFFLSDTYSNGLIILCLATLARGKLLSLNNLNMNQDKLEQQKILSHYKGEIEQRYGSTFYKLLLQMLQWEAKERITMKKALEIFNENMNVLNKSLNPVDEINTLNLMQQIQQLKAQLQKKEDEIKNYKQLILEQENVIKQQEKKIEMIQQTKIYNQEEVKPQLPPVEPIIVPEVKKPTSIQIQNLVKVIEPPPKIQERSMSPKHAPEPLKLNFSSQTHEFEKMLKLITLKKDDINELIVDYRGKNLGNAIQQLSKTLEPLKQVQHLCLNLSTNNISDQAASSIGQSLENLKTLLRLELYLGQNNISALGATAIGKGLISISQNLNELQFGIGENVLGDEGAIGLANGLTQCKEIQKLELYVSKNQIGTKGARAIVNALKTMNKLKEVTYLNLKQNGLSQMEAEVRSALSGVQLKYLFI